MLRRDTRYIAELLIPPQQSDRRNLRTAIIACDLTALGSKVDCKRANCLAFMCGVNRGQPVELTAGALEWLGIRREYLPVGTTAVIEVCGCPG